MKNPIESMETVLESDGWKRIRKTGLGSVWVDPNSNPEWPVFIPHDDTRADFWQDFEESLDRLTEVYGDGNGWVTFITRIFEQGHK